MENPTPRTQHIERTTGTKITAAAQGRAYARHALSGAMKASLATILAAAPAGAAVAAQAQETEPEAPSLTEGQTSSIQASSDLILKAVSSEEGLDALKKLVEQAEELVAAAKIALDIAGLPISDAQDAQAAAQAVYDKAASQHGASQRAYQEANANARRLYDAAVADLKLRRDEMQKKIADAEKRLQEAQESYADKQQAVTDAQVARDAAKQALDALVAAHPNLDADIQRAQTAYDEAIAAHEAAIEAEAQKAEEVRQAESAVASAESDLAGAQSEKQRLDAALSAAEQKRSGAQQALSAAQADLAAAEAGTDADVAAAQAKVDACASALSSLDAEISQLEADVSAAAAEVEVAKGAVNDATGALTAAQTDKVQAQSAVAAAEVRLGELKSDLDAKKAEREEKENAVGTAEQAIKDAQAAYDAAELAVVAAQDAAKEAQAAVTAQQAELDGLVEDFKKEQAWSYSAAGFFEYMANSADIDPAAKAEWTQALNILRDPDNAEGNNGGFHDADYGGDQTIGGSTHIGQAGDATTLDNLRLALQMIARGNEVRKDSTFHYSGNYYDPKKVSGSGLADALLVSPLLMAIAMVDANGIGDPANGLTSSSEYCASQVVSDNLDDPFNKWASSASTGLGYVFLYDAFKVCGFGVSIGADGKACLVQTFYTNSTTHPDYLSAGSLLSATFTTDGLLALIDAYEATLVAETPEIAAARALLEQLAADVEAKEGVVTTKVQEAATLSEAIQAKKDAKTAAEQAARDAVQAQEQAQAAYDGQASALEALADAVTDAEGKVSAAQAALDEATEAKRTADGRLSQVEAEKRKKQEGRPALETALQKAKDAKDAIVAAFRDAVSVAQAAFDAATGERDGAQTAVDDQAKVVTSFDAALTSARGVLSTKRTEHGNAVSAITDAATARDQKKGSLDALAAKKSEVDAANASLIRLEQAYQDAVDAFQEVQVTEDSLGIPAMRADLAVAQGDMDKMAAVDFDQAVDAGTITYPDGSSMFRLRSAARSTGRGFAEWQGVIDPALVKIPAAKADLAQAETILSDARDALEQARLDFASIRDMVTATPAYISALADYNAALAAYREAKSIYETLLAAANAPAPQDEPVRQQTQVGTDLAQTGDVVADAAAALAGMFAMAAAAAAACRRKMRKDARLR